MPISAVRAHQVIPPLHTPFVTALQRTETIDSLLVEVVDGGRPGWGEAPEVWRVIGDSMGTTMTSDLDAA